MIAASALHLLASLSLVLIYSKATSSDTFDTVELLGRLKFPVLAKTVERCLTYEEQLRRSPFGRASFHEKTRHQLYKEILHSAARNSGVKLKLDEKRVLADLRECLVQLADRPAPSHVEQQLAEGEDQASREQAQLLPQTPIALGAESLLSLSKLQQDTKTIGLAQRCQSFDENLRQILDTTQPGALSSAALFQRSIKALSSRQLPFGNSDPVLAALQECVDKFPEYQLSSSSASAQAVELTRDETIVNEMAPQVRELTEQLGRLGYKHADLERRFEEQSRKLAAAERELASARLVGAESGCDALVMRDKDEQIALLTEQLHKVEQAAAGVGATSSECAIERGRYLQMKELYEQVAEREAKTSQKLRATELRLAQLVARLRNDL